MTAVAVELRGVVKRFASAGPPALDGVSAAVRSGRITGLVGPDGAGKTTLIRLMTGLMRATAGTVTVLGRDAASQAGAIQARIGYMPQRFGLYEDLTVMENLRLYADLRGVTGREKRETFERLLGFTDLNRFTDRLAGALSGGMKQKLGLACAMIRRPELLLLDEPSVGVDPVSRRELWRMTKELATEGLAVVWSTAYLDEAELCDEVLLLSEGRLLHDGPPGDLTESMRGRTWHLRGVTGSRRAALKKGLERDEVIDGVIQGRSVRLVLAKGAAPPPVADLDAGEGAELAAVPPRFEDGFVDILQGRTSGASALAEQFEAAPRDGKMVIEAEGLTKVFGTFTAAKEVSFRIGRGEIFGLLGPNGAGKSTTFKMMCGLLKPSSGTAKVDGFDLQRAPGQARARIGYMAQKFSLYGDLSVGQNLEFFSGVYGLTGQARRETMERMADIFDLGPRLGETAGELPLGFKQRLALACAVMHRPATLFLDEPTSGVDPLTRREFWTHINGMVEKGVTVMVTTHFMDEAEYCDRIGLIYRGRVIAAGSPDNLKDSARSEDLPDPSLEDAFIELIRRHDAPGRTA